MLEPIFAQLQERFGSAVPVRASRRAHPPEVIWDPKGARILKPDLADGTIGRRLWAVEVEVWGEDIDKTVALVDRLRGYCHDLGSHFSFPPEGVETWDSNVTTGKGILCVLQLEVKTIIPRTPQDTVAVTDPEKIVVASSIEQPDPGEPEHPEVEEP